MADRISALRQLTPNHTHHGALTEEEGLALIRARRRGVTLAAAAEAMGYKQPMSMLCALGTWAVRHARLPEEK